MGAVRDLAERSWNGDQDSETEMHPGRALVDFEVMDDGLGFMSAFSNALVLDTDEGLVFIDTSSLFHANKMYDAVRAWSNKRVHTGVYTHGHVDHVFGLLRFVAEAKEAGQPPPRIIAHEACPARFDRYKLTNGYNGHINARQFGFPKPIFPKEFTYPDETVAHERVLEVGGVKIELHHDKGETDDHLWAWLPEHRALYTGDMFIWASPNCGNPQKVQRFPLEWAAALRRMASFEAETLFPGHGPPIFGRGRVAQALDETATLLETICQQTLALMNDGATLDDVLHGVNVPGQLLERPYLRPVYDHPLFVVRNLWRLYGGWYDGNPAHLVPPRAAKLGRAVAELAGGAAALAEQASRAGQAGDLEVACELIEMAWHTDPSDPRVRGVRGELYRARAKAATSLMAKGIYGAAARDSSDE